MVSSTKIYLDARQLLDIILDIVPNFPRAYKFTIGSKMEDLAVEIIHDIAAAYINKDKAETAEHLTEFQARFETLKTLIRELLAKLGLRLNEKKFYLQHYTKGIEFIGSIVKPGRVYTCNRTITNFIAAVRRLNKANNERQAIHAISSINSYLGLLRHTDEYANRRKILNMIEPHVFKEYVYIKGHYEVLALRNKHKLRYQTMQRIRNGDY